MKKQLLFFLFIAIGFLSNAHAVTWKRVCHDIGFQCRWVPEQNNHGDSSNFEDFLLPNNAQSTTFYTRFLVVRGEFGWGSRDNVGYPSCPPIGIWGDRGHWVPLAHWVDRAGDWAVDGRGMTLCGS